MQAFQYTDTPRHPVSLKRNVNSVNRFVVIKIPKLYTKHGEFHCKSIIPQFLKNEHRDGHRIECLARRKNKETFSFC